MINQGRDGNREELKRKGKEREKEERQNGRNGIINWQQSTKNWKEAEMKNVGKFREGRKKQKQRKE